MTIGNVTIGFEDVMLVVVFLLSLWKRFAPPRQVREIRDIVNAVSDALKGGNGNAVSPSHSSTAEEDHGANG